MCSGYVTQVSEPWPLGLLFFFFFFVFFLFCFFVCLFSSVFFFLFFFLPYKGMVDILFNDAESFEQIDNTLSTESPM